MKSRILILLLLLLALLPAQEFVGGPDFLTDYEADVLREKQDIKQRLLVYRKFAALRLELVDQLMASPEDGRAARVHDTLDEYTRIIESIDDVIDDALIRNKKMDGALEGVLQEEQKFIARLEALAAEPQEDAWRYKFILEDAIGTTRDSSDLLSQDLGVRKSTVVMQELKAKQRREASMSPERQKESRESRQRDEDASTRNQQKRPTLLSPEERLKQR